MASTSKPWDGSASRWPDTASFCDSCAYNGNTGDRADWVQAQCKLPFKEPNGDINTNALGAASAALAGARGGLVGMSSADKKKAAKKLISAYSSCQMDPPDSLKKIAG